MKLTTKKIFLVPILTGVLVVSSFTYPPAQAQTTAELERTIDTLIARIAQLHAMLLGRDVATTCSANFTSNLKIGSEGAEVLALQQFLNSQPGTKVTVSGEGSPGNETRIFGPLTAAAVSKFQEKYRSEILTPNNLLAPTGYWGPSSRAKANSLCRPDHLNDSLRNEPIETDSAELETSKKNVSSGSSKSTAKPKPISPPQPIIENEEQNEVVMEDKLPLGISFPPVSTPEQLQFTQTALEGLDIERVRFAEDWALRESVQGVFNWDPLDTRLRWAQANDLKVLLTIQSNAPDWYCAAQNDRSCVFNDTDAFKSYVETLLARYPNQIDKIQFGNEWQTTFWYAGTAEEFVTAANILYDAVQEYSPQTTIVLGGFTTSSLRYLAACTGLIDEILNDDGSYTRGQNLSATCASAEYLAGLQRVDTVLQNAKYDEVDIHLYDDPIYWQDYHNAISARMNKDIVVSEFGGPHGINEPTDDAYQAQRLQVYLSTLSEMDINEAYFFKLVEGTDNPLHQSSGLYTVELTQKPSYDVLRNFNAL